MCVREINSDRVKYSMPSGTHILVGEVDVQINKFNERLLCNDNHLHRGNTREGILGGQARESAESDA